MLEFSAGKRLRKAAGGRGRGRGRGRRGGGGGRGRGHDGGDQGDQDLIWANCQGSGRPAPRSP
eukprot:9502040-Pyramimonas_sp.AAC.1